MTDRSAAARFLILRQIYDLACEQRDALELDDLDRFQRILDEREELIARLRVIDGHAGEPAELPENVVAFPGTPRAGADDDLALDTVIRGILDQDRGNESLLAEKMEEIREALPALSAGQRAASGYRVVSSSPSFIDTAS